MTPTTGEEPPRPTSPCSPGRVGDRAPLGAGLDARGAGRGIDAQAGEPLRAQEDRVAERRERDRAVARGLRRDLEVVLRGEADDRGDVVLAARVHHGGGPLVGDQVPRAAGAVVALVARAGHVAGHGGAQRREVDLERWGDGGGAHRPILPSALAPLGSATRPVAVPAAARRLFRATARR